MSDPKNDRLSPLLRNAGLAGTPTADLREFTPQDSEYTWEQAMRVLKKNRTFALALAGTMTGIVILAALCLKDVYQPIARVDIEAPTSGIRTLQEIESSAEADYQDYLETQVQILKSDALAMSVIRALHLDKDAAITAGRSAEPKQPQSAAEVPDGMAAGSHAYLREQLALATLTPAEAAALDRFRRNLSVNTIRNTRLVEIGYASHDPQKAQQITNAVVAAFIDNGYKQRYATTMQTSEWLSSQLDHLRHKLEASSQAVSDYQRKHGLVELDDRDVPMSQLMAEVNHQLSDAQASRIEAEAFVRMIDLGQADSVPAVRDDQVYQTLLMRYADLRAQLAQSKTVYGDASANVKKLDEQTGEIAKQIDAERGRIAERLRTSYAAAQEREKLMLRSRERLRAQMGDVNSQLVGYHLLKNEAMADAEIYNTLQGRLEEAGIYAGLKASNIHVVDLAANVQRPASPNRPLLIASGALVSCFLGVLVCFMKESLNNTVRTPDDIRSWIGMHSLALLPLIQTEGLRATSPSQAIGRLFHSGDHARTETLLGKQSLMKPSSMEAEALRELRTVLFSSRANNPEVILISSSMEGEGKTTVAANFAVVLAQLGRTCLLEADLRRPTAARAFGIEAVTGLSDVVSGTVHMRDALVPAPGTPNLWILPSGGAVESPADVLVSARLDNLCATLIKEFDYVVIDSPPVIGFSDARSLSRLADEVVLVGRCGITTRRSLQRATELLREVNAPLAGVVLNGIDLSSADYHYFTYGYSKKISNRDERPSMRPPSLPPAADDGDKLKSKAAHA